jgi:hypothetical protein
MEYRKHRHIHEQTESTQIILLYTQRSLYLDRVHKLTMRDLQPKRKTWTSFVLHKIAGFVQSKGLT